MAQSSKPRSDQRRPPRQSGQAAGWSRWKREIEISVLLCLAVAAVYGQVGSFSLTGLEDTLFTTDNLFVTAGLTWEGIQWAFINTNMGSWHPLTWISHMLDYSLFGADLGAHHLTSVVLHGLNTLLVFWLLRSLTGAVGRSAVVALLFAIHPMQVEAAVWLGDRKGVLSTLFALLATWVWAEYTRRGGRRLYAGAFGLFLLGLMSKPMLVTLSLAWILVEYWPLGRWSRAREVPRLVAEKAPFIAAAIAVSAVTYWAQRSAGAMDLYGELGFGPRLVNAAYAAGMYVWKTLWPVKLVLNYPVQPDLPVTAALASFSIVVVLSAAAFWQARLRPFLFTGWFWFFGIVAPVLGMVQTGDQNYADRYAYLPHVGFFLAAVWLVHDLAGPERARSGVVKGLVVILGLVMVWQSYLQVGTWRDDLTFGRHTTVNSPRHVQGRQVLGKALMARRQYAEALREFETARDLRPDYADSYRLIADAQFRLDRKVESLENLERALVRAPNSALTHYDLGLVLRSLGRRPEAIAAFRKAVALGLLPDRRAEALLNVGLVHNEMGQFAEAIRAFQEALEVDPHYYLARKNLGFAYLRAEKFIEAVQVFELLARVREDDEDVIRALRFLRNRVK